MKLNHTYKFIFISSLALVIVLIIQMNWIYQTATMKEELFNEKATLVLSKTAEALSLDTTTIRKMQVYVGQNERRKIDSLLVYYMRMYHVQIAYFFEVKQGPADKNAPVIAEPPVSAQNQLFTPSAPQPGCYQTCLPAGSANGAGFDLKLVFPDKEEFILAEMGLPFITSVVLIVVVLVMFWKTILSLMKEKEISEHTTDFLNNMTHEFKTPLTNIALAGKMMVKDSNIKREEKVKHYSGIILEENEKLIHQVEQVLSMTALERGEIPLRKSELDFHQLLQESLKCISVQLENKQGETKMDLEAENFVIVGDRTHLTNTICNLVDNAIKYSGENPELLLRTYNENQNLVLIVSDKGIGIEEKYQEKVFDKFFRIPTGNIHDVKGFGLGLAYVKKIIEMHEGSITLQSETDKGTSFTIKIPYV